MTGSWPALIGVWARAIADLAGIAVAVDGTHVTFVGGPGPAPQGAGPFSTRGIAVGSIDCRDLNRHDAVNHLARVASVVARLGPRG